MSDTTALSSELGSGDSHGPNLAQEAAPGADGHTHETHCLNCGTELMGPHCHSCGQHGHIHRTAGAFFHDLLHGALHLEGRTWRTLPLLAFKPGELTRRYIAGERTRFVSPMALFLFSVFLMFAVFQIVGLTPSTDLNAEASNASVADPDEALSALRKERADLPDGSPAAVVLDTQIGVLEAGVEQDPDSTTTGERKNGLDRLAEVKTGWAFIDHGIEKWHNNPGLMVYKLQANSYKFSWLLIPLSVPFVWLIFAWRRKFGAYDHSVFVTYSLSFMTLLFVSIAVLSSMGVSEGLLSLAFVLIPPVHLYKQLRGAYSLSRFSAGWRTVALSVFILIVLLLFVNVLLLLGALG